MKLTPEQKEQLKGLSKHPGYKILEMLEEDQRIQLGNKLLDVDLSKEENISFIEKQQIYIKARKDFFKNIERHLKETYIPN